MNAELAAWTVPLTKGSTEVVPLRPSRDRRVEAVVRGIVRRERAGSGTSLPDETVVALVIDGLRQASRCAGVSERTLRRQIVRDGLTVRAFITRVRLQTARELYALGWRTDRSAAALGYSDAAAFRRFLRRSSGEGVWSLRKVPWVRKSPRAQ